MATLASPPRFALAGRDRAHLTLAAETGARAHIFVLQDDILRVAVLPSGRFALDRTWAIAPGEEDCPTEGRDRFDTDAFVHPSFELMVQEGKLVIETARIRLGIKLDGFFCEWNVLRDGEWRRVAKDRPTQAYNFGWWDDRVHHYLARDPRERYFGLGERAGEMDRAGARFRMSNVDAMGYSARTSDPLYKHIPFYLTWKPDGRVAFGLFYDTLSDCVFDLGCERSNYHGLYRAFVAEHGDLDYYFIAGPDIADVVRRYTWLTGRPAFLPRWSLGYSGSTMSYTDAPDAQARMAEFLAKCEAHDIPCDSFHLSSGYSSIGKKRYVFHWNREKFPDPAAFARSYAEKGVHLAPNLKPCLLQDHPLFEDARVNGLFIRDGEGAPNWVQFWDEIGAYLDFTNPETLSWWKEKVTSAHLRNGLDSTWNDNNEFEIVDDRALQYGFGKTRRARETKPLHALQMTRASREAQMEFSPGKRPYVVTRSGAAGMQRYAQTWSGDNATSWETLKYNLKMGLGLALSGISNTGHDVGGFAGPKPSPELFARWVAFGIFMPRFSIHSWNDDGSANEPWMYPETTPIVRALIKLRYRLLPQLYDLMSRYHHDYEPVIRPTFFDFPGDPRTFEANDEMMLGPSLLVAPVVGEGETEREVYLPHGPRWHDFWTGEVFAGGKSVIRPAPLDKPVLFVKEGGVIALDLADHHFAKPAFERGFSVFPPRRGSFRAVFFEDDGESDAYRTGTFSTWSVGADCDDQKIALSLARSGALVPNDRCARIILPPNENRRIESAGREEMFEGKRSVVVTVE